MQGKSIKCCRIELALAPCFCCSPPPPKKRYTAAKMEPANEARKKKAILLELPCFPSTEGGTWTGPQKKNKTFFEVDCGKSESSIMFRFCVKLPGAFSDAWCNPQPARWISRSRGDRLEALIAEWLEIPPFPKWEIHLQMRDCFWMVMLGYQPVIVEGWSCW